MRVIVEHYFIGEKNFSFLGRAYARGVVLYDLIWSLSNGIR